MKLFEEIKTLDELRKEYRCHAFHNYPDKGGRKGNHAGYK
jgi:hypothetical protein